jgi:hypothetical protein
MAKNSWMIHVAKFRKSAAGKGLSLSAALKAASKTYAKKKAAGGKKKK